jgi:aconitate decarboxylase
LLDYGQPFRIVDPGMAYKFFPSKYPTQFAITAALDLHKKIGDVSKISRVVLTTPMMQDVNRPEPKSGLEGKFSFQYSTAVALLDGKMRIDSFSDERRFRADVKALLPKIELNQSKDMTDVFHKMHVVLAVETSDGKRYETECRKPKGFWGVEIPLEDHMEKMQDCMSSTLNSAQIDEIAKLTAVFETLEAGGVRKLISLISGSK